MSGNIGAGKTTLCKYLQEHLPGSKVYFEKFELNEHLQPFYEYLVAHAGDGSAYNPHALPVQLNFLLQRVRLEKELDAEIQEREAKLREEKQEQPPVEVHVIDRSIFEDNEIFAKNQLDSGMMTAAEYQEYLAVYSKHIDEILPPDLMVILHQEPKVLHERVMARGREMEKGMTVEYLQNLNHRYADSLEPLLQARNVRYIRQQAGGPQPAEEANRALLQAVASALGLADN